MPDLKPLRTDADHLAAMNEVRRLWGAKLGTPDGDRLDVLATLIDAYETANCPLSPPDPIAAIEFRMEQQGLTRRDLQPLIGSRETVIAVLARRRPLSIGMIRRLHRDLGIAADTLIQPVRRPHQRTIPTPRRARRAAAASTRRG